MKNFNIEDQERKTPYKVPENFFAEVQANVLKNIGTNEPKNAPIFFLRRYFPVAAAASAALIGGLGIFWFQNTDKGGGNQTVVAQSQVHTAPLQTTAQTEIPQVEKNDAPLAESQVVISNKVNDNQEVKPKIQLNEEVAESTAIIENPEKDFDNMLTKLSPEEIKQATENTDKDVYLDLYN